MPSPPLDFLFEPMDFLMAYATLSGFFIPGSQEYPGTLNNGQEGLLDEKPPDKAGESKAEIRHWFKYP